MLLHCSRCKKLTVDICFRFGIAPLLLAGVCLRDWGPRRGLDYIFDVQLQHESETALLVLCWSLVGPWPREQRTRGVSLLVEWFCLRRFNEALGLI